MKVRLNRKSKLNPDNDWGRGRVLNSSPATLMCGQHCRKETM